MDRVGYSAETSGEEKVGCSNRQKNFTGRLVIYCAVGSLRSEDIVKSMLVQ